MFTRETIDDGFTLTTDRLTLRWPRIADGATIETLAGRKSVADMTALIPHPYPEGAAGQFIFASRLANARGEGLTLAITGKKRPRDLVGVVALQAADLARQRDCDHPFIGFWLGVDYWGRGYATEAVSAMIDLGFQETGARVFGAEALTHNVASLRVLQKLGFEAAGSGLVPFPARGGMLPVVRMQRQRRAHERSLNDAGMAPADGASPVADNQGRLLPVAAE